MIYWSHLIPHEKNSCEFVFSLWSHQFVTNGYFVSHKYFLKNNEYQNLFFCVVFLSIKGVLCKTRKSKDTNCNELALIFIQDLFPRRERFTAHSYTRGKKLDCR